MRFLSTLGATTALLLFSLPAQQTEVTLRESAPPAEEFVADSYIIHFKTRSFDLEPFRAATYARRPVAEIEAIVRSMEQAVQRDQAQFVADVANLGGRVTAQWWIINGAAISGNAAVAAAVAQLPYVERVERDRWHHPVNGESRNTNHHKAEQANQLQTGGGQFITGTGVTIAILDTGVDGNMGGTGRPHRGFYVNGDSNNHSGTGIDGSRLLLQQGTSGFGTEDAHGHGTHVAGSAMNGWGASGGGFTAIFGMAPNANLVGVKISNDGGSAAGTWIIAGWNWVAANAAARNIKTANNSFSGSPSLSDGIQVALDNCARNADVLISCSAGNSASDTTASQNVWNGLAVGALNKNSLTRASFSAIGPLDNHGRIYPDISAVGNSVFSLNLDSETTVANSSGTSMSSPMIAGCGALVRQVDSSMTALEAKALLLNNTRDIAGTRNDVGLGIVNANRAVLRALANDYRTRTISTANPTVSINFTPDPTVVPARATIAFHHIGGSTIPNVDLFIFDSGNNQVASSTDMLISYDRVQFNFSPGTYRAEIRGISNLGTALDVAISGIGGDPPPQPPTLVTINPGTTTSFQPVQITLTGTNLDQLQRINLGSTQITNFITDSATQVRFTPPSPFEIATHTVTAQNAGGTSNPLNLTIAGIHPGFIDAPTVAFRTVAFNQVFWSDRNWSVALFVSTSNVPSSLPGIVNLGIGNAFAELFYINTVGCDTGGRGVKTLLFPASFPVGNYYFQGIPYNPAAPTLPLETTNVVTTFFL